MNKPYIGLTGINTRIEAQVVAEEFTKNGFSKESSYIPMFGVLISNNTLNDIPPKKIKTPNMKYPNWRPIKSRMETLAKHGLPMIHYTTKDKDTLPLQIKKIFGELFKEDGNLYDTGICQTVQLNIVWPNPNHLEEIIKTFPDLIITLQLSSKALGDYNPQIIAEKLAPYKDFISYALIDPSGGKGKDFDVEKCVPVYKELRENFHSLTFGFAGNITGDNLKEKISAIYNKLNHKNFCIDSEGGLRVQESHFDGMYADDLDLMKVRKYISNAGEVFLKKMPAHS